MILDALSRRFKNGPLGGPTSFEAVSDCGGLNAGYTRPLSNCFSNAVYGRRSVAPCVVRLLAGRSPSAVLRRVVAIVIYSVYCFAVGLFAHVFKKIIKGFEPSIANRYAPAPVFSVLPVIGVGATLFHVAPYAESWSSGFSVCGPSPTTARFIAPVRDVRASQHNLVVALKAKKTPPQRTVRVTEFNHLKARVHGSNNKFSWYSSGHFSLRSLIRRGVSVAGRLRNIQLFGSYPSHRRIIP